MASLPVAVNKNLDHANTQTPIAAGTPVGALGGIKADGTTITVNQATGVASVAGAGGGTLTGTLTPGKIPVATAAHVLGDSHLDDGLTTAGVVTSSEPLSVQAHAAIGVGATIDGTPDFFTNPTQSILNLIETLSTIDGENGIYTEVDWNPSGDIPSGGYTPFGLGTQFNVNLDGQATADSTPCGIVAFCTSSGDITPIGALIGALIGATNQGNSDATDVVALDLFVTASGSGACRTSGILINGQTNGSGSYTGINQSLNIAAGHLTSFKGVSVGPTNLGGGAVVDSCIGLEITDQNAGTNNWAIKTGLGLVELGDSLILDPMTSDPSSLTNGEIWYNGTEQSLNARINGATVALGPGGAFSITQKLTVPGVFNFPSIPQTKFTLVIDFIGNSNGGFDTPWLQFNGDTGTHYTFYFTQEGAASATTGPSIGQNAIDVGLVLAASAIPNTSVLRIIIPGYTDSSLHKNVFFHAAMPNNGPGSFYYIKGGGVWLPATDAPITSLLFQMNPNDITSGFFATGSICTISGQ